LSSTTRTRIDERASTGTATASAMIGSPAGGRSETAESVMRATRSVVCGGEYCPKELRVWCIGPGVGVWRVVRPRNVAAMGQCGGVPTTVHGDTGHQSWTYGTECQERRCEAPPLVRALPCALRPLACSRRARLRLAFGAARRGAPFGHCGGKKRLAGSEGRFPDRRRFTPPPREHRPEQSDGPSARKAPRSTRRAPTSWQYAPAARRSSASLPSPPSARTAAPSPPDGPPRPRSR